jgi:predicted dehydrogenase
MTPIGAAVAGVGFIGAVHAEALRRIGVDVVGVVRSRPASADADPPAYASFDEMLADDRVQVVHIATPNNLHLEQAGAALEAGKHVVCEKPLAMTSRETAELVRLAEESGLVHCTNFNIRFYPQVRHARALVRSGAIGEVWTVSGSYLQDWLLRPSDWNWRLEPGKGGKLRAVSDIGSHWMDLLQFVTGRRIEQVLADLMTALPVRRRPKGEVKTFAAAADLEREDAPISTEDVANMLFRFEGGARGTAMVSQVNAGRKNALRFEIGGSEGALAWDSERPEELWIGHRDRPNELLLRNPELFDDEAGRWTALPAGHAEGFSDTFKQLYRSVYAAVAEGAMPPDPDFPTFHDGHWEAVVGEAVARSNEAREWVEVS